MQQFYSWPLGIAVTYCYNYMITNSYNVFVVDDDGVDGDDVVE